MTAALSRSRGGSANSAGSSASGDAVRDEPLPGIRAAREEGERRAHGRRRVVERAANRQLLVVQAERVDPRLCVTRQPAEHHDRPARTHELDRVGPRLLRAGRLEHDVRPAPVARLGAERVDELAPLLAAADDHRPAAGVGDARREHQPDRPGAEDRDGVARLRPPRARRRAGSTRAARAAPPPPARVPGGTSCRLTAAIALRHDDPVRVRAGEELQLAALLAPRAAVAGTARRRVGGDHASPVDEPAELVPERRRRFAQQDRMPAAVRLQIRAVGQRDLDLHEHLAGPGLGLRHVLDAQVARRVQPRRLHGVNTTFSAVAAAVQVDSFAEPLERQDRHLGQNERRQELDRGVERRRRRRARADDTQLLPIDRVERRRHVVLGRREDEQRAARLEPAQRVVDARGRGDDGAVDRIAGRSPRPAPALPCQALHARVGRRRPRRRGGAAPAPTAGRSRRSRRRARGPRGTSSAARSTQASGSTQTPPSSSIVSGSGTQCVARSRSANPPGAIRTSPNSAQVDSWPARQRSHAPHGTRCSTVTRVPSSSSPAIS